MYGSLSHLPEYCCVQTGCPCSLQRAGPPAGRISKEGAQSGLFRDAQQCGDGCPTAPGNSLQGLTLAVSPSRERSCARKAHRGDAYSAPTLTRPPTAVAHWPSNRPSPPGGMSRPAGMPRAAQWLATAVTALHAVMLAARSGAGWRLTGDRRRLATLPLAQLNAIATPRAVIAPLIRLRGWPGDVPPPAVFPGRECAY